jgi:hypothetical protein
MLNTLSLDMHESPQMRPIMVVVAGMLDGAP